MSREPKTAEGRDFAGLLAAGPDAFDPHYRAWLDAMVAIIEDAAAAVALWDALDRIESYPLGHSYDVGAYGRGQAEAVIDAALRDLASSASGATA